MHQVPKAMDEGAPDVLADNLLGIPESSGLEYLKS